MKLPLLLSLLLLPMPGCEQGVVLGRTQLQGPGDLGAARDGGAVTELRFQLAATYPAPAQPSAVLIADITQDHLEDLIVPGAGAHSVSVFPGTGAGAFGAAMTAPTGEGPQSAALADLNRDGLPDLITANRTDGSVSVLLGGGGGLLSRQDARAGDRPASVAIADLDQDGWPDVIVAVQGGSQVAVLRNRADGTGGLSAPSLVALGDAPDSLAVGDLSHRGRLDVLAGSRAGGGVAVLLNQGDGRLVQARTYWVTGDLSATALLDLTGDLLPDLVAASGVGRNVSVLRNTGGAEMFDSKLGGQRYQVGDGPQAIAAADFNGDGRPDLATVNSTSGTVSVLLSLPTGDGGLGEPRNFAAGEGVTSLAAADVNGDGLADLVAASPTAGRVYVLLNTSR